MGEKSWFKLKNPLSPETALFTAGQWIIGTLLFVLGFEMLIWGFSGKINFGTYGDMSHFNAKVYMIVALLILSSMQIFIATSWARRIIGFAASFIGGVIVLMILGGYFGWMSAIDSGNTALVFTNLFLPFSVDVVAVGDLTVGLNIKIIADSVVYFIHGMIIFILIIQIIYAEGSGEFVKAMLEAVCVAVVMIIFGSGGGLAL